ncbi:hypothetical protein C1646_778571 [Rhizophagus diaphanus]|nr:hypothetical protein C1646_778571 [Rhizophagus diaphanus] [Rhizophagus sp. MUCL 43196]
MANMFVACLKEKKILTKILAITADNVANNNTFLKSLYWSKKRLSGTYWVHDMCMICI